jgi:hypothetical protein
VLNPAPGIRFLLDFSEQHLLFVQDWPIPVLQAVVQVPQWAGSVLRFVHTSLHRVPEHEQVLFGALPVQV